MQKSSKAFSSRFLIKFWLKMKENAAGELQTIFSLISNQILIEKLKKMLQESFQNIF